MIVTSLLPSKAVVPVVSPARLIFLAAESLFAVSDTPSIVAAILPAWNVLVSIS